MAASILIHIVQDIGHLGGVQLETILAYKVFGLQLNKRIHYIFLIEEYSAFLFLVDCAFV